MCCWAGTFTRPKKEPPQHGQALRRSQGESHGARKQYPRNPLGSTGCPGLAPPSRVPGVPTGDGRYLVRGGLGGGRVGARMSPEIAAARSGRIQGEPRVGRNRTHPTSGTVELCATKSIGQFPKPQHVVVGRPWTTRCRGIDTPSQGARTSRAAGMPPSPSGVQSHNPRQTKPSLPVSRREAVFGDVTRHPAIGVLALRGLDWLALGSC